MIIYKATNKINGKCYIGKTTKNLKTRKKQHIQDSKKSKYYFHRAINKYGSDNFQWEIIEKCKNESKLSEREEFWIEKNGDYNIIKTSRGPGCNGYKNNPRIDEIKETISKGVLKALEDDPSIRQRISEGRKKAMLEPGVRERYKKAAKKRCNTKEWKEKQSIIAKKQMTDEKKKLMLNGLKKKYADKQFLDYLDKKQREPGGAYSKEVIRKRSNSKAEDWFIWNDKGEEYTIKNLSNFCKEHNLSNSSMSMIASGKRNVHKGWKCRKLNGY
jgi:group I intron endonuclease